jgi:hypothetical protein
MRNLLAFLAAVALTVAGVGWYLGWFQVRSVPSSGGQRSFTVDVNTQKIGHDFREAEAKVQKKLVEKSRDKPAPGKGVPGRRLRYPPEPAPTPTPPSAVDLPEVDVPTIQIDR